MPYLLYWIGQGVKYLCHLYNEQGLSPLPNLEKTLTFPLPPCFFIFSSESAVWLNLASTADGPFREATQKNR